MDKLLGVDSKILDEQGYFWWRDEKIPDGNFAPENHITGRLTISDDGVTRLELDGVLPTSKHPFEQILTNDSVKRVSRPIQGLLKSNGQHVLIIDAIGNGGAFNSNRFSYERYWASMCLVGSTEFHRKVISPLFSKLEVDLTGFEEWLNLGTLNISHTKNLLKIKSKKIIDRVYDTPFGKIVLSHGIETKENDGYPRFEFKLREFMRMSLKPKASIPAGDVQAEFTLLQDLMIRRIQFRSATTC